MSNVATEFSRSIRGSSKTNTLHFVIEGTWVTIVLARAEISSMRAPRAIALGVKVFVDLQQFIGVLSRLYRASFDSTMLNLIIAADQILSP